MAKFPAGVLGPFYGIIGPITGCRWKSINYGRSLPGKSTKRATPKQGQQRTRFGFVSQFLSPLRDLIKTSFSEYATNMTEYNNAISYTLKNAVSGSYPDFRVHYDQLLVSRGSLPNAMAPSAVAEGNKVHFSWTDNTGVGKAAAGDKTILVAWCPEPQLNNHPVVIIGSAARSEETDTVDLSAVFEGKTVHTWLAFISSEGLTASSVYTGGLLMGATAKSVHSVMASFAEVPAEQLIFEEAQAPGDVTARPGNNDMQQEPAFEIILQLPTPGVDFGLQKGQGREYETVQRQRSEPQKDLHFNFHLNIKTAKDGSPDFHGPLVQGPPGARFVYIDIGKMAGQKTGYWERRLKIPLQGITREMIDLLLATPGAKLETRVPGTGKDGTPNCGTVKPFEGWNVVGGG